MHASVKFKEMSMDPDVETFRRFVSTMTINKMKTYVGSLADSEKDSNILSKLKTNILELTKIINEIKDYETNPNLLSRYQSF